MKTLFKYLSTIALALVLFVPAKTTFSADFPPGTTFKHIVGKVLEPHRADKAWTTADAIDFGFMTRYVKICLRPNAVNQTAYFRMNTTFSDTIAEGIADTALNLFPGDSSAIFINGTSGASFDYGALPMRSASTTGLNSNTVVGGFSSCITEPWATRGIIMHIASGLATADVWGYR